MRITAIVFFIVITAVALSANVSVAVPPDKYLEYSGGGAGKVIFNGGTHNFNEGSCRQGCMDCHPNLFSMRKGAAKITLESHKSDYCFVCHEGTKAFAAAGNCAKCHGGSVVTPGAAELK